MDEIQVKLGSDSLHIGKCTSVGASSGFWSEFRPNFAYVWGPEASSIVFRELMMALLEIFKGLQSDL